jgi:hypothetical protein
VSTSWPAEDAARRLVVERNLAPVAFGHLTTDAFMNLPFEALAPTKTLLKRYFSSEPWSEEDADALSTAVGPGPERPAQSRGPGEGQWRRPLDDDVTLEYGWAGGRFAVRVTAAVPAAEAGASPGDPLAGTFDGPVVPEATPNPRTIRFQVGPIHDGPSRWYESPAAAEEDPGAARLFAEFADVANVLVGPDFVAVGIHRPADWERLLRPVLAVVTDEFASAGAEVVEAPPRIMGGPAGAGAAVIASSSTASEPRRRISRLQQAWRDLGGLRPADSEDLVRVLAAAGGGDAARRQVAASLLREADAAVAATEWGRLAGDPVRSVRRAATDAMVDVGRDELRPLLEAALDDDDAWVRWKALRGLAELGAEPSRAAIEARAGDPDFRVRLEVAAALR